jgi:DNA-binding MarR family transcriptional regulator
LTFLDTKDIFGVVQITDPRALRALAHPLRLDLVELLGVLGQATAAECARRLDTSQASCSFHLRQLAKYGFVEEAQPSEDSRERPWRLTELEQNWSADAGPAADQLERVFVQREADRILGWLAADDAPQAFRKASFVGGATIPLTVDELESVRAELRAALEPYIARLGDRSNWPADARLVRILLAGTPLDELTDPTVDNPEEGA